MAEGGQLPGRTANDRFKEGFGNWFWGSLAAAVVVHFLIFALWPDMATADIGEDNTELETVELPDEIEIPPPPEQIQRPATPVISDVAIDEDITIAETTFESNPVDDLPPPPTEEGSDLSDAPAFTPREVDPRLTNRAEVQDALERYYPRTLKDAGIGGTATLYFFISEEGRVEKFQIHQSSGHDALDNAALRVADVMEYSPALNRDQRVPVWVQINITFSSN